MSADVGRRGAGWLLVAGAVMALQLAVPGAKAFAATTAAAPSTVVTRGDAASFGSPGSTVTPGLVDIVPTPSGQGYWVASADGRVFRFGNAPFLGDRSHDPLNKPIVAMAATPTGKGYWLAGGDGAVYSFGDAGYYGSFGGFFSGLRFVDMAASPSGQGY